MWAGALDIGQIGAEMQVKKCVLREERIRVLWDIWSTELSVCGAGALDIGGEMQVKKRVLREERERVLWDIPE